MPSKSIQKIKDKLQKFYDKHKIFERPIKKLIKNMFNHCKYKNEHSIERHNFGELPVKLKNIPNDIHSANFEKELMEALEYDDNDKSIIELLWGDIQLGKRIQACIIMWISVFILKRPVIYIFRNLKIDQKQLDLDIRGADEYDFNIKYIKHFFDKYMSEEIEEDDYKEFKLPELKDINNDSVIDKLSNKDTLNPKDIFCCLMNYKQLEKINSKINEYICNNSELVNITLIVDESDLYAPTSSNCGENNSDLKDSTQCEQLLAQIYKKVRYVLHITGTAHSLLYNVTTKLTDNKSIQIPISKVHKMKRNSDYYGLFNNNIHFETESVKEWWNTMDSTTNKLKKYTLQEDYNININPIIKKILHRNQDKYHSLLISEEKIKVNQLWLANTIISDFKDLFIIVFHGNCLKLYFPRKYERDIKFYSQREKRLYESGGIRGASIEEYLSNILPNDYVYFDIDTKTFNLKQIYKLLAMLFIEPTEEKINSRTVITITGKYGERGYSFTSDNYDKYSFHLTDQYFPCHVKNKNCTDISQRLRLQGKYKDNPHLILWTSNELKDIITKFFVPFMEQIEMDIMNCDNWVEIKDTIEDIIAEQGNINFNYMKYIDVRKKNKNWNIHKHYEKKHNGFRLIKIDDMTDEDIDIWCEEQKLPKYNCINEIKNDLTINEYIEKYGDFNSLVPKKIENTKINSIEEDYKHYTIKTYTPTTKNMDRHDGIENCIRLRKEYTHGREKPGTITIIDYKEIYKNISYVHLVGLDKDKILPKMTTNIRKRPYYLDGNNVKYSNLKKEYLENNIELPEKYYWKTPDGWLFLHDITKNNIMSIDINPIQTKKIISPKKNLEKECGNIGNFIEQKIISTEKKNLRFGISDIYQVYNEWCNETSSIISTRKEVKYELEKMGYKEELSKGVNSQGKSGKRGYNIDIKL